MGKNAKNGKIRVSDQLQQLFEEVNEALPYPEVVFQVNARLAHHGIEASDQQITGALHGDPRFEQRDDDGFWGLTAWRTPRARLAPLVQQVLAEAKAPMSRKDVFAAVIQRLRAGTP